MFNGNNKHLNYTAVFILQHKRRSTAQTNPQSSGGDRHQNPLSRPPNTRPSPPHHLHSTSSPLPPHHGRLVGHHEPRPGTVYPRVDELSTLE